MKHVKSLILATALVGIGASSLAQAQYVALDKLTISQLNPAILSAFQTPGSIVNFYGENYVVNTPATCSGANFNAICTVGLAHLSNTNPGVTVNINQVVTNVGLVTTVTARPDGKTFNLTYQNTGIGTAPNVVSIVRTDNL
ncbi:MAG: hypothetical protein K0S08_2091 [Gammaproteobacteria bacterium]|jgi:hypothetical protein|nr:hypothetical protein [Gammaproteobacteria bacterium]